VLKLGKERCGLIVGCGGDVNDVVGYRLDYAVDVFSERLEYTLGVFGG